ncbi:MAG: hypothetical protein MK085_02720 [Phycisphaerales bacterium]|nr:hypothetical protein [Phycisphaerales bacterium]
MADPHENVDHDAVRTLAASLFNRTWDLLELDSRTTEQDEEMVHAAHASRHHWGQVGKPINLARGDWQIARVYAELGRGEPALHHARRCLAACEADGHGPFDLGFAHEGLARAFVANHDRDGAVKHLDLALKTSEEISDEKDRAWLKTNLDEIRDSLGEA